MPLKLFRKNPHAIDAPMTPAELAAARATLEMTVEQFADAMDITVFEVERYESGAQKIPAQVALLARSTLLDRRHADVMRASGLPECAEGNRLAEEMARAVHALEDPSDAFDDETVDAARARFGAHGETCELCRARAAYAQRHAPPMPELGGVTFKLFDVLEQAVSGLTRVLKVPDGVRGNGRRVGLFSAAMLSAFVALFPFLVMIVVMSFRGEFGEAAKLVAFWIGVTVAYLIGGLLGGWVWDATRAMRLSFVRYVLRGAGCASTVYGAIGILIALTEKDASALPVLMTIFGIIGGVGGAVMWVVDRIRGKLPRRARAVTS